MLKMYRHSFVQFWAYVTIQNLIFTYFKINSPNFANNGDRALTYDGYV